MNEKIALKTIAIKDLWNVFRGCWMIVIVAAIIATAVTYVKAKMDYSPRYSSTATLYLIGDSEDGEYTYNDFAADYTIAFRVIGDSDYLLKSRTVLNKVGEAVGISNGYSALYSNITIKNPEETRVLEITATSNTPEKAKKIVDSVCEIGAESINEVLKYNKLQVFEPGSLNRNPMNSVSLISYVKYGAIAAVLVYIVFLAMFLFDNYIHTEEDIDRYLGLSILGDIPDAENPNKKKSKYTNYKGYSKKQSDKQYYASYSNYGKKD